MQTFYFIKDSKDCLSNFFVFNNCSIISLKHWKIRLKFLALILLLVPTSYSIKAATYDYDYYHNITYSWIDKEGISHDNVPLTDKATSPEQIMAFLQEVYTNPQVPGTLYEVPLLENNSADHQSSAVAYSDVNGGGWNIHNVTKPIEGTTMLMVEVNDTWSNSTFSKGTFYNDNGTKYTGKGDAYKSIAEGVKSIQIITSSIRIEDQENPVRIFNIRGMYDRFFFISKGKNRACGATYPFYNMFEEYSPTLEGASSISNDFYDKMTAGNDYAIQIGVLS